MTAEIAVMNKNAVALAADSAVSTRVGDDYKVFPSANKIFGLSKSHPVGIMVFGNSQFMRLPWETTIKMYRDYLGELSFSSLGEYAENFITFLTTETRLFPEEEQFYYVGSRLYRHFASVREEIEARVNEEISKSGEVSHKQIEEITATAVTAELERCRSAKPLEGMPKTFERTIRARYGDLAQEVRRHVFGRLPISSATSRRLNEIVRLLFTREIFGNDWSGLVVAGFGTDDIFPSVHVFQMEGIVAGRVKGQRVRVAAIRFDNAASILPFAQQEMVISFMEGVDPVYQETIEGALETVLEDYPDVIIDSLAGVSEKEKDRVRTAARQAARDRVDGFRHGLSQVRRRFYVDPVVRVVSMLPKEELAAMAESLVNLTSFKRKMSPGAETVGGPIDVAVISRGDGFVWIRRKHYFSLEMNPQFLARYFQRPERRRDE